MSRDIQQDLIIELLNNVDTFPTAMELHHQSNIDLEDWAMRAMESIIPSKRGKENYEPDGFYEGYACTCKGDCPSACEGKCGCQACQACYVDHRPE